MATERIEYVGKFDVSNILNSIKQMRKELEKTGDSDLFAKLDKEYAKLEKMGKDLGFQVNKGFSSMKDFKTFENNVSKLETEASRISQSFKELSADNFKKQLDEIERKAAELNKKTKEILSSFEKTVKTKTPRSASDTRREANEQIMTALREGKKYLEVEKEIDEIYKRRIQQQKQLQSESQAKIANIKNSAIVPVNENLSKDQFVISQGQGRRGLNITDEQFNRIKEYWQEAIRGAENGTQAMNNFDKKLKEIDSNLQRKKGTKDTSRGYMFGDFEQYGKNVENDIKSENLTIKNLEKTIQKLKQEYDSYRVMLDEIKGAYEKTSSAVEKNKQAENENAKEKEKVTKQAQAEKAAIDNLDKQIEREGKTLKENNEKTEQAIKVSDKLNNTLERFKNRLAYIFSLGNAFYQLRRMLTQTLNDVNNIDKAFSSIAMVTDKTISGLWEHYGEYASMAQKLGQSTESAIKASALFYQQGLKDAEVMELTEETMKLATLAGLDFEKATSQMTAALRGFHMEMDQGAHITDVYSELAAHAAADVNGIAYAMSKTASIANSAGMSFENTAAFLTQMIETTQEAPENIG